MLFLVLFMFLQSWSYMDKKKSILNVTVSVFFKVITMVLGIFVKRQLIQVCGNDVNGLNALYLSIIGILSVTELGIGSAITFCMYRPIVDNNRKEVAALYQLFRRLYLIIGGVVFVCGLAITPFIKYFAKDYAELDVNLYLTFVLMLISVVITYLFGAKTALINAYKNDYITTSITSGGLILQDILQIIVLIFIRSFPLYLVCRIVVALLQWIVTDLVSKKKYPFIMSDKKAKINKETRKGLVKSIKAMFMHKVGGLLVNTADSIIISAFVGVVALGEYSNYVTIMSSMTAVIQLVFVSLTSVLGHLYVEASKNTTKKYCEAFHLLNFVIGTVFYLGYYSVIDNVIAVLFSPDLVVDKSISFVITLNGFIQFMRASTLVFRDSTGTFYNDRWKPLVEGIFNVVFSILFVNIFGVTGVIVATIMTNLLICHIIEPYVLYKNAFSVSPKAYYLRNYVMIAVFIVALFVTNSTMVTSKGIWSEILINGVISLGFSLSACLLVFFMNSKLCRNIYKKAKLLIKR